MVRFSALGSVAVVLAGLAGCAAQPELAAGGTWVTRDIVLKPGANPTPAQLRFVQQVQAICDARSQMYAATAQSRGAFGGFEVQAGANRARRACVEGALTSDQLPTL